MRTSRIQLLANLVDQLKRGVWQDEQGHSIKMNKAFIDAKDAVEKAEQLPQRGKRLDGGLMRRVDEEET